MQVDLFSENACVPRPQTIVRTLNLYIYGQERLKRAISTQVWQHYSRLIERAKNDNDPLKPLNKPNLYVIGDSGTGKTLTSRIVGRLIGVPFVYIDATELSDVGYRGEDVNSIAKKALAEANGNIEKARWSYVFVDEFDKKAQVLDSNDDVNQRGVQSGFLSILEGKIISVDGPEDKEVAIDTADMLFTFAGAHEGLDKLLRGPVGFKSNSFSTDSSLIDALIKFGISPQVLGRFQYFVTTDRLSKDGYYNILKLEKNPIFPDLKSDFARVGIKLEITEAAYDFFAELAAKDKTGARALAKTVNSTLLDTLYELSETTLELLIVDEAFLRNPKDIVARIKDEVKMKEPEDLITIPKREEKKLVSIYQGYNEHLVKTNEAWLRQSGLADSYVQAAAFRASKEGWEDHSRVFDAIALYNSQIDQLESNFLKEFGKNLDITSGARELLVVIGLKNFDDAPISDLIDENIWRVFKENSATIQQSRKKKLRLEAADIENPLDFLERIKKPAQK